MRSLSYVMLAAAGFIAIGTADVQAFEVDKPIDGYNCMSVNYKALHVPDEEAFNGTGLQSVFAGPTEASRKLGTTGGTVYVEWPLNKVNGFVRILRPNGEHAWISEIALKPFQNADASSITCTLYQNEKEISSSHLGRRRPSDKIASLPLGPEVNTKAMQKGIGGGRPPPSPSLERIMF